jgi:hypothetical protein
VALPARASSSRNFFMDRTSIVMGGRARRRAL